MSRPPRGLDEDEDTEDNGRDAQDPWSLPWVIMYSVIRPCEVCRRDVEFRSDDNREWWCGTCGYLRYGALGAQGREKAEPGMITRGPLMVSLGRRSRRREVVAAGTFLEASQPPDK